MSTPDRLDDIRIVLVRTFHPGNIGAVARAAKTMGLSQLHLVEPRAFPHAEANKMAAGAADLIEMATVHSDLSSAIADCRLVVACTARPRNYDLPELNCEAAAELALTHTQGGPVAIVFGPERMGLHNQDLVHAQYRLTIPANPLYSSLNLAAAVQIVTYELFKAAGYHANSKQRPVAALPTASEFEQLVAALAALLRQVKFFKPHEGESVQRLAHFLRRVQPTQADLNILRGAIKRVFENLK